jgi:hypothetical protein
MLPLTRRLIAIALASSALGCAAVITDPRELHGLAPDEVTRKLGTPTYEVTLINGMVRRFYPDSTSFVRTWRADFDETGRLTELVPATTSGEFAEAVPGTWKKSELLERFGRPDKTDVDARTGEIALFYLFRSYGIRDAYMVFLCDRHEVLATTDIVPLGTPPARRVMW